MRLIMTAANLQKTSEGLKTQTRRLIKLPDIINPRLYWDYRGKLEEEYDFHKIDGKTTYDYHSIKPRYPVGCQCWIPEPWAASNIYDDVKPSEIPENSQILYKEELDVFVGWIGKRRVPRFMCKWMARRWVEILRVIPPHRIQNISEEDCIDEGAQYRNYAGEEYTHGLNVPTGCWYFEERAKLGLAFDSAKAAFADEWESIHGPGSWSENKWVMGYEYKLIEKE